MPQKMLFLLFTWPERRKCASSENHTSSMWSFGTHFGENIQVGPFDLQTEHLNKTQKP